MSEPRPHIQRRDGYDLVRVDFEADQRRETGERWMLARCPFCDGPAHGEPCPEVRFWSDEQPG